MFYAHEECNNTDKRFENIQNMRNKYRLIGGFGIYNTTDMLGTSIKCGDINGLLHQEELIIDMYNNTYDHIITRNVLEKMYLGRKCVNIPTRIHNNMCTYCLPYEYKTHVGGLDPVARFLRSNSINGYMKRLYWSEKEIEQNRFYPEICDSHQGVTKPLLLRSK